MTFHSLYVPDCVLLSLLYSHLCFVTLVQLCLFHFISAVCCFCPLALSLHSLILLGVGINTHPFIHLVHTKYTFCMSAALFIHQHIPRRPVGHLHTVMFFLLALRQLPPGCHKPDVLGDFSQSLFIHSSETQSCSSKHKVCVFGAKRCVQLSPHYVSLKLYLLSSLYSIYRQLLIGIFMFVICHEVLFFCSLKCKRQTCHLNFGQTYSNVGVQGLFVVSPLVSRQMPTKALLPVPQCG